MHRTAVFWALLAICLLAPVSFSAHGGSAIDSAIVDIRAGRYDAAERVLEPLTESEPENAAAQYWYAVSQVRLADTAGRFKALGMGKRARKAFAQAVALEPDNARYRIGLMRFYIEAPSIVGGDPKKAVPHAKVLQRIDPPMGELGLARVRLAQGDAAAAATLLGESRERFPTHSGINAWRVQALIDGDSFAAARRAITEWRASMPDDPHADFQLGQLAAESGQYGDAGEAALQRYIARSSYSVDAPDRFWARLTLATVLAQQGRQSEALAALDAAEAEAPENHRDFGAALKAARKSID